jgi:hypothetical protein
VFFSAGSVDLNHAFALALGVEIALIALAFGLTFLLPGEARPEGAAHGAAVVAEPVPVAA